MVAKNRLFRRGVVIFFRQRCPGHASELAYATLLSIAPLLMVSWAISHHVALFHHVATRAQALVLNSLVADSAKAVIDYLQGVTRQVVSLSLPTMCVLFGVCLLMIHNAQHVFNAIWGIPHERHWVSTILIYALFMFLAPLFMCLLLLIGYYVLSIPLLEKGPGVWLLTRPLLFLTPIFTAFTLFTLMNRLLPHQDVPWRAACLGGAVTTILFHMAKFGFSFYVDHISSYRMIYGTVALLPIFLVWLYVSWLVILLGAVITRVVAEYVDVDSQGDRDGQQ